jgi:alkaline phosphatase D
VNPSPISRRRFSQLLVGSAVGLTSGCWSPKDGAPAVVVPDAARPKLPSGVMSGDVSRDGAVLWSRCDRPARMVVEAATTESMRHARRYRGPVATPDHDFIAKFALPAFPPGERIFYRVRFEDLSDPRLLSEPVGGSFRIPPLRRRTVRFVWSGDTVGQGWGIDESRGGMTTYEAIRRMQPDFLVHSGDTIYADVPLKAEVPLPDGSVWRNLVTPAKSKVAETAAEFRGNHLYNLEDANFRRLCAEVPILAQWDDHEVLNNWYPGEILDNAAYREKSVSVLAGRSRRAFFDCLPIRGQSTDTIYRTMGHGPELELFFLDMRTYRGPNSGNRQTSQSPETAYLGAEQLGELKLRLKASKATWKVMCSDMPLGLIVGDTGGTFENSANGNGPALGRELEIADLLGFMKRERIRNVIWITADVHYAASHFYNPDKAQFQDFDPFWEFVSGPLHAGTFGPNALDNTFGPEVRFTSLPKNHKGGTGPAAGLQFFGVVDLDGETNALTVSHHNAAGAQLWSTTLPPV